MRKSSLMTRNQINNLLRICPIVDPDLLDGCRALHCDSLCFQSFRRLPNLNLQSPESILYRRLRYSSYDNGIHLWIEDLPNDNRRRYQGDSQRSRHKDAFCKMHSQRLPIEHNVEYSTNHKEDAKQFVHDFSIAVEHMEEHKHPGCSHDKEYQGYKRSNIASELFHT